MGTARLHKTRRFFVARCASPRRATAGGGGCVMTHALTLPAWPPRAEGLPLGDASRRFYRLENAKSPKCGRTWGLHRSTHRSGAHCAHLSLRVVSGNPCGARFRVRLRVKRGGPLYFRRVAHRPKGARFRAQYAHGNPVRASCPAPHDESTWAVSGFQSRKCLT